MMIKAVLFVLALSNSALAFSPAASTFICANAAGSLVATSRALNLADFLKNLEIFDKTNVYKEEVEFKVLKYQEVVLADQNSGVSSRSLVLLISYKNFINETTSFEETETLFCRVQP